MIKRILVYGNRKCDPSYWDASTPELERAAMVELFEQISAWGVYGDLEDDSYLREEEEAFKQAEELQAQLDADTIPAALVSEAKQKVGNLMRKRLDLLTLRENYELYQKAVNGDVNAIIRLLKSRQGYEYEQWSIEDVQTATL